MRPASPIRGIDHVLFCTPRPRELFNLLTQDLSFPVAWNFNQYDGFAGGGIFLWNMNLEVIRFDMLESDQKREFELEGPRYCAIALKPRRLKLAYRFLQTRNIPHQEPQDFYATLGKARFRLSTNITIEKLLAWNEFAFICSYRNPRMVELWWWTKGKWLSHRSGGPLSLKQVDQMWLPPKMQPDKSRVGNFWFGIETAKRARFTRLKRIPCDFLTALKSFLK